jgi:hypothetical protein
MAVSTTHPTYTPRRRGDWLLCQDAYLGESEIKWRGETYLPRPSGYSTAGGHPDNGDAAYRAYKERAQFPELMSVTVGAMVALVHERGVAIEVPTGMEYLHENANGEGMTLAEFHRRITRSLLVSGRYGVLADAPAQGGQPYLEGYKAGTIINWEDDGTFYVLDETEMVRSGFAWTEVEKYRVLRLEDGRYVQEMHEGGVTDITPTALGGGALDRIPFVVASARDLGPDIETPPLIGVARAAKAIYQLSADYRLQLYMSGQETLVALNGDAPQAVGAGVVHQMFSTGDAPADLKYVSPTCSGIDAHLSAMRDQRQAAIQAGARMLEPSEGQESGKARSLRFPSETANLLSVAQVSCSLLERSLRNVAALLGQNEDEVTVSPPHDLMDATMTAQDATSLWQLVIDGGMSWQTFYERLQKGGIMSPDRDHEEEYEMIQSRDLIEGEAL